MGKKAITETAACENHYDDEVFFEKYSKMDRSVKGLSGAGEWHEMKKLLPDFHGKTVLDLGCGFGWHCVYAVRNGAKKAVGIDLSEKMLARAKTLSEGYPIEYLRVSMQEYSYPASEYDAVLSSLALHYVEDLGSLFASVAKTTKRGGNFVFSIEHPVFTAEGKQDWLYGADEKILCWPVDRYFEEGERKSVFLGETVKKYHHTLTSIFRALKENGFLLRDLVEPTPDAAMADLPGMRDELRRPMMLLIAAERGK